MGAQEARASDATGSPKSGLRDGDVARDDRKGAHILDIAKTVFLDKGFAEASMDEIAAVAGVSKMTIYRRYASKEMLFAGVIAACCDRIVTAQGGTVTATADPRRALLRFARTVIDTLFAPETIALHRIVIAECRRFPTLGHMFYEYGPEGTIRALTRYLEDHRHDPRLRIRTPRASAEEFLSLLRGYTHLRLLMGIGVLPSAAERSVATKTAVRHLVAWNDRCYRKNIPIAPGML